MSSPSTQAMVSQAIKVQLTRLGQTQTALAEKLNVGPMWVSARLTGSVPIDVDDIDAIATALGMPSGMQLLQLALAESQGVAS